MSPPVASPAPVRPPLPTSALITPETLYTLGGATAAVWLFSRCCMQFTDNKIWLRSLALAMSLIISFVGAMRRKISAERLLVAFFNALLICATNFGVNTVNTSGPFAGSNPSSAQGASFFSLKKEVALWPPLELVQENAMLQLLRTERTLDEDKILSSASGKQREALKVVFELYKQKVPYKWGGKDPHRGFDSSGFVAYVLSKVGGVIRGDPATYWSGKLRESLPPVPLSEKPEVGDILFYTSGACMIYLGDRTSIGMLPGGIVTGDLGTSPEHFGLEGVGRY